MSVDKETVYRVAHLARIGIDDQQIEPLVDSMNSILNWVEQLNEIDTHNVEPMASIHDEKLPSRADEVTDGGKAEKVTRNAPSGQAHFFAVPKVVE